MARRPPHAWLFALLVLSLSSPAPAGASNAWEELAYRKLGAVSLERCLPAPWAGVADLGLRLELAPSGRVLDVGVSHGPPPQQRGLESYELDGLERCVRRKLRRLLLRKLPAGREPVLLLRLRATLSTADLEPGFELDLPPQEPGPGTALVALFRVAPVPLDETARLVSDRATAAAAPGIRGLGPQLVGCLGPEPPPLTLDLSFSADGRPALAADSEDLEPEALTCLGEVLQQVRLGPSAAGQILRATWAFGPSPGTWVSSSELARGRLDKEGAQRAIWGSAPAFLTCWELTAQGSPVQLKALVRPDGSVHAAGALAWQGNPRGVATCLARTLATVVFPEPAGPGWAWLDLPITPPGGG